MLKYPAGRQYHKKGQCPAHARPQPTVKATLKAQRAPFGGNLTLEAWGVHQAARPTRASRHLGVQNDVRHICRSVHVSVCLCVRGFRHLWITNTNKTPAAFI
jgi:hypothetical protein